MPRRILVLLYGTFAYLAFLAVFVYTIGFLANVGVPKGIDEGRSAPIAIAVIVDAALLGLFAVQHTVMARPGFKHWWVRVVPESIERSTFVLAASLVLALVVWLWLPLAATVWTVEDPLLRGVLYTVRGAGWVIVVASTFLIDHFDLFGLRQVVARAREHAHRPPGFRKPGPYRLVRHPMMIGFLVAFWATPDMSAGRSLFAALASGYILVGVRFEEHDLRRELGEPYERYLAEVPRFVPRPAGRAANIRRGPVSH